MYELAVLKVEDPSSFWCEVTAIDGFQTYDDKEYKQMYEELDLLYSKSYRNVEELRPAALPVGEFCMVFCEELNSWCRATLESPTCSAEDGLVECFLLDHAMYCPVKKINVRLAVEECKQLPFRAKRFRLHQVQPVSLSIDFYGDKVEFGPSKRWDIAAIQYFRQLVNESTCVEAKICSVETNSLSVYLYITTKEGKVCVNDELVAKNFACFSSERNNGKTAKDAVPKSHPKKSLSPESSKSESLNAAQVLRPTFHIAEPSRSCRTGYPVQSKTELALSYSISRDEIVAYEKKCEEQPDFDKMNVVQEVSEEQQLVANEVFSGNAGGSKIADEIEFDEKQDSAKLLQILNPNPVNLSEEENEEKPLVKVPQHPIFVSKTVIPCSSLECAPLSPDLKKELSRSGYDGPSFTQSYCWPSIAQGLDTILISPDGMSPMNYIPPLLTFLHFASGVYKLLPTRNGPLAVLLCSGWTKAQTVFELLLKYSKFTRPLHPALLLIGLNKEESENLSIRKGCEVIVSTPHSLLRYLEWHGLLLLRQCHLVLDEVELLFAKSEQQVITILESFKRMVAAENRDGVPQQIVATGTYWHKDMDCLLQYTADPQVVITRMEQAAVCGNVQQVTQLCLDCDRAAVMLRSLDFTPENSQKILIFTDSDEEAELVHKVVKNNSVFSMLMNKSTVHSFGRVLEQWKKIFSRGTHVVLVVTDDYTPLLEITDATCVIHYSFPKNKSLFGLRLFSLLDYIRSRIEKAASAEQDSLRARSVLIMTEKHARYAVQILQYLRHTGAQIPPELLDVTQGILQADEQTKLSSEICRHVKAFGACGDKLTCFSRHHIDPRLDLPNEDVSASTAIQYITVIPTHIVDAARFFGRIVTKEDAYGHLAEELMEYYQHEGNKEPAEQVEMSGLYALQEGSLYHRVQVLSTRQDNAVISTSVKFVDEGRTDDVRGQRLLKLPSHIQSIPHQAAEFIVCRVKPIDNETEWDPKVTRIIRRNIKGKLHSAKVVLRLGNTYWLDPVVQVRRLPGISTVINELNVRHEILFTGLGTDNPEHIQKLKSLVEEAVAPTESESRWALLGVSGKCKQNFLHLLLTPKSHVPECRMNLRKYQKAPRAASRFLHRWRAWIAVSSWPSAHNSFVSIANAIDDQNSDLPRFRCSFHPEVKWFEKDDSVILTVKLREVTDPTCVFYADRVVFSCHAGGKYYVADLWLSHEILKEKSGYVVNNGQPVITLSKAATGPWSSLLRQKCPNVTFDFDHLEDPEDSSIFSYISKSPQNIYTIMNEDMESESSSEFSDSDSD
ncbi:putative ATP-dependent RNA helicase TDRD12 [Spea bombifrons]|uniref:putative ATP-dependent RNA helicase TDRD12 n=1 Tax=Spea bombifrons TaxID=233779 RepID=UPI0023492E80|nr:putative ATP-dependent RNA helicase TDRD12 [Spea bombifrons]